MKFAAILLLAGVSGLAQGIANDLAFETSAFMRQSAYRNVRRLNPESAPDGAYGTVNTAWDATHTGNWYIEEQRYGADLVGGGIATHDTSAIDRGLLILGWGFQQQQPDGGFRCPDAFHSTSFFVEAAAHSLLLIEASEYGGRYHDATAGMKGRLLAAAKWMTNPKNEVPGREHNQPYTHRRYLVGAALGETGVLLHNAELIGHSENYIREGIALQDPAGFNPERGGWDSSYHAVGTFYAECYYTIVAGDAIRPALRAMLEKAIRWEAGRTNAEGEVSAQGNTRVGGAREEKGRSGKTKTLAYGTIYRAFEYWSRISGDQHYHALAEKVARFAKQWHDRP